jgi:hypothetical protein
MRLEGREMSGSQLPIPEGITTDDFFQVYRSGLSANASSEPNDEMGLVYEANPTSGELAAKSISVTDQTPEDLRGATLYTSDSQEGLAQANEPPPFAKDIAYFKGCLFYGNVKSKQRKVFTVISVGGTQGIQLNDVLTIAGTAYTAKASEDASNDEFQLSTGGTPAQNIADTALSLVRVINQSHLTPPFMLTISVIRMSFPVKFSLRRGASGEVHFINCLRQRFRL